MKRSFLASVLFFVAIVIATPAYAAGFTFTRSLSLGSSGTDVSYLQLLLNEYHYLNTSPTGYYGPATAAAVAFLQQVNNLPAVGSVGPQTLALLNAAEASGSVDNSSLEDGSSQTAAQVSGSTNVSTASTQNTTTDANTTRIGVTSQILRPLGVGSVGGDVTLLQQTLASLGYLNVSATGYFGSLTKDAVIAFQKAEGLNPVGTVGPLTRSVINTILSGGTPASASGNTVVTTTQTAPGGISFGGGSGSTSGGSSSGGTSVTSASTVVTTTTSTGGTAGSTSGNTNQSPLLPAPSTPAPSTLANIAAGCAVPAVSAARHIWYVDPVNGTDGTSADGSEAHPWKTLQTVLNTQVSTMDYIGGSNPTSESEATVVENPNGKIHAGDEILLMSGKYPAITVMGVNKDFITIAAAPGQTPLLQSLTITGAAKWVVQGLKIQSLSPGADTYKALVTISPTWNGLVDDIVFDHNNISSADSPSAWTTKVAWLANAQNVGISMDGGTARNSGCLTVTNNNVANTLTGVTVGVDHTLFEGNTINDFGHDALDYSASNIVLSHNLITNNEVLDSNHPDGMQGQIGRLTGYSNVLIDSNTVIRQTNPNVQFPGWMQGIDAFDDDWTNITVTNNIVITNAGQGLSFSSVHGGLIANNTVLWDGNDLAGTGTGFQDTWVGIFDKSHEGSSSNNVVVRNNISTDFIDATTGATVDHNIARTQIQLIQPSGNLTYYNNPGTYGNANILDKNLFGEFVNYNPTNYQFDVHLAASSTANGAGNPLQAPAVDHDGTPRVAPIAAGAYTSHYSSSTTPPVVPPVITPVPPATTTPPIIPPVLNPNPATTTPIIIVNPPTPPTISNGATFHMTFDKATISGTVVADQSGSKLNGTLVGAPTSVPGKIGDGALAFNGSSQGVNDPASLNQLGVSGNHISISAWFNNTDTTNPAQTLVARGAVHSSANNEVFDLLAHDYANKPDATFSDGTNLLTVTPAKNDLTTNTWYNVVVVLDGQTAYMYLNGSLVASSTNSSFGTLKDISTAKLGIGYDGTATRDYFTGDIDDVQIFNSSLSANDVAGLQNQNIAIGTGTTLMPVTKTLVAGAAGADVSALQELLKTQGYFTYPVITGDFLNITKAAVTAFQKAHNIDPIGLVGPQTRAMLNELAGVGQSLGF